MNALSAEIPRSLIIALLLVVCAPGERVLTPEGERPRTSVHALADGEAVDAPPATELMPFDLDQGWIAYTFWKNDSGVPLRWFSSTWRVPPPPATRHRQTLFFFNGLQNSGANYGILQPVLQWGVSAAGGGDYWSVASWYVTSRGQAFHTPLQRVEPGDVLVGEMRLVGEARGKYSYSCELLGMPRTRLLLKNVAELSWSTESMEAYNVSRCSDYPGSRAVPFTDIRLQTDVHPAMRWTAVDRVTDCEQHAEVVSHSSENGQVVLRVEN
jgi:hypothetical protein